MDAELVKNSMLKNRIAQTESNELHLHSLRCLIDDELCRVRDDLASTSIDVDEKV